MTEQAKKIPPIITFYTKAKQWGRKNSYYIQVPENVAHDLALKKDDALYVGIEKREA